MGGCVEQEGHVVFLFVDLLCFVLSLLLLLQVFERRAA
jgi:hypothetical protein